ncbi:Uncharacterized protein SCF082_LOCUS32429 [Durusdinium trenchii]|uniref:Mitochondrial import inner membrane translocase subunit TIM50 n=1 Tax=Durusdinium trenchii TaxID=1381693 RepID=A0ABP0NIB8_9DINO
MLCVLESQAATHESVFPRETVSRSHELALALQTAPAQPRYRKLVLGTGSGDLHVRSAPKDSLPLLGHIELTVPKLEDAKLFWMEGLGCDETYNASTRELWAHLGPSQVRFKEGSSSTSWPGEIRIWVEDIRSVADMLNMLGRTLDTKIVEEMREARTGGEYAALLHDPGLKNKIEASEAPGGWSAALRQIPIGLSAQAKKKNALAISDAVVHLPTRTQIQGVARFYDHYIGSAITKKYAVYEAQALMDICIIHFAPGAKLHQTLTYKADKRYTVPSSLSSVCIYMKDHGQFHLAYAKCKTSDLLSIECSKKSWEEIESQKEFLITGVMDPQDHSMVLRLPHILSSLAAAFKPPGAKGGLVTMAKWDCPWIYTTSTPNYTKALMRHVDPGGKVFAMRVLTRDQCTPCQVPGFFLKDMSLIRSKMDGDDSNSLQRRILVDNNPVSCVLHPSGSVLVRDWLGDAEEDQELERLQKLLEALLQDSQGDYAARLAQMTRGFQSWRTRLKALGELLEKTPPSEADGLRSIFRDVSRECNDMKRELLGAAP